MRGPVLLTELPVWFLWVYAIPLGLFFGSFLNVVIYRLPRGLNLAWPGSHCPACGAPIRAWHNVPLFGWLWLRGKARCCGVPIPFRYPLVEAIGGLAAAAILQLRVLPLPPDTSIGFAVARFALDLSLVLALVAATFIDLELMEIPDELTYTFAALGLITSVVRPETTLLESALAAAGGYGFVWLLNATYRFLRGMDGMGMGDAKLLMVAGAWFGATGTVFTLGAGAVQGMVAALVLIAVQGKLEEPEAVKAERAELHAALEAAETDAERAELEQLIAEDPLATEGPGGVLQARLAFGPFLALGMIEYLLLGPALLDLTFAAVDGVLRWGDSLLF